MWGRYDTRDEQRDRGDAWDRNFGIRIDAKRKALDALDAARRSTAHNGDANGDGANQTGDPGDRAGQRRPHVTGTSQFGFAGLAAFR